MSTRLTYVQWKRAEEEALPTLTELHTYATYIVVYVLFILLYRPYFYYITLVGLRRPYILNVYTY